MRDPATKAVFAPSRAADERLSNEKMHKRTPRRLCYLTVLQESLPGHGSCFGGVAALRRQGTWASETPVLSFWPSALSLEAAVAYGYT